MSERIYISRNGKEIGVFSRAHAERAFRDLELHHTDSARTSNDHPWRPISEVITLLANEEQKAALRFLGSNIPRGISHDAAEQKIAQLCFETGKKEEFRLWRARYAFVWRMSFGWDRESYVGRRMYQPRLEQIDGAAATLQREKPNALETITRDEFFTFVADRYPDLRSWAHKPATQKQLKYLSDLGVPFPSDILAGEASNLIDEYLQVNPEEVTEGQRRRLKFYGIPESGLTRYTASELIDRYLAQHPESEIAYQVWKLEQGLPTMLSRLDSTAFKIQLGQRPCAKWTPRRIAISIAIASAPVAIIALGWFANAINKPLSAESTSVEGASLSPESSSLRLPMTSSALSSISPIDQSTPTLAEFVRLTTSVTLYNSRGKEVKRLSPGKRLRVINRAGDTIVVNYVGDDYTIPAASTEPSK